MIDQSWSIDIKPICEHFPPFETGPFTYCYDSIMRSIRVSIKSGSREVLTFHAVKPDPPYIGDNDHDFMTIRRMADPNNNPSHLDLNPLVQLLADAELGRKVREAGLEIRT